MRKEGRKTAAFPSNAKDRENYGTIKVQQFRRLLILSKMAKRAWLRAKFSTHSYPDFSSNYSVYPCQDNTAKTHPPLQGRVRGLLAVLRRRGGYLLLAVNEVIQTVFAAHEGCLESRLKRREKQRRNVECSNVWPDETPLR